MSDEREEKNTSLLCILYFFDQTTAVTVTVTFMKKNVNKCTGVVHVVCTLRHVLLYSTVTYKVQKVP